jgi:tRNA threonylcarbamoyladenosine biosynthesis protein TsaE
MVTVISHSPAETELLGRNLGRAAQDGCVFGITGDLGAGKTRLALGIARGLGIKGRIPSPSFALVHEHKGGRLPLFHLDLYRLESMEQILASGLEPYFAIRNGVAVVEWYERWTGPAPTRLCRIHLVETGETERRIEYDPPRD